MRQYYIYTDGSCYPNPGYGAYAYITIDEHGNSIAHSCWESNTTNNRMEVTAIIKGLEAIDIKSKITIFSDSLYAINIMHYKTNINKDLRKKLISACNKHIVTFTHVKAHSNDYYNDLVDSIAYEELYKAYQILGLKGLNRDAHSQRNKS